LLIPLYMLHYTIGISIRNETYVKKFSDIAKKLSELINKLFFLYKPYQLWLVVINKK